MKIKFQLNQLSAVSDDVKKNINKNIVLISGEMGAGKTTLIKEILKSMNVIDNVSSPTFSIINEYNTSKGDLIYHMDLYRIKSINELDSIGLFEYLQSGKMCIIEWGDMIERIIESEFNKFVITKEDELRIIEKIIPLDIFNCPDEIYGSEYVHMGRTFFARGNSPQGIYIKGGQVLVRGVVDGQYTIVTDDFAE